MLAPATTDARSTAQPPVRNGRNKARATAVEKHVGERLRQRRVALGLTQGNLADILGVTYQQAHKYERGVNRISCSTLLRASQALNVPVGWFFAGADDDARAEQPHERMAMDLAQSFFALETQEERVALVRLARVMADAHRENPSP